MGVQIIFFEYSHIHKIDCFPGDASYILDRSHSRRTCLMLLMSNGEVCLLLFLRTSPVLFWNSGDESYRLTAK